ncbi:MAG: hypothetical protein AAF447_08615, partial [Myxococcota bacterium]
MRFVACALLLLVACSKGDATDAPTGRGRTETASPEAPEPEAAAPRPSLRGLPGEPEDPRDPLAGLDDVEALRREAPDVAGALALADLPPVPEGSCAVLGDVATRVWPKPGPARVVAVNDDGFVAAGYAQL